MTIADDTSSEYIGYGSGVVGLSFECDCVTDWQGCSDSEY